jgi:hypothetical protein
MKLEAKQRLQITATLDEDFKKSFVANLNSMSPSQLRSLTAALKAVKDWFGGGAMGQTGNEKIKIQAKVDLNLAANGMVWLDKVFNLSKAPTSLYRIHDMLYVYGQKTGKSFNQTSENRVNQKVASLVRAEFPAGTVQTIVAEKPLLSFTTLKPSTGLNEDIRGGGEPFLTDAYLQIPTSEVQILIVLGPRLYNKLSSIILSLVNPQFITLLTPEARKVVYLMAEVLERFRNKEEQREAVCLIKNNKFQAKILRYAV